MRKVTTGRLLGSKRVNLRLTIAKKLMAAFGFIVLLVALVGGAGVIGLEKVRGLLLSMYEDRLVPMSDLYDVYASLLNIRINVLEHVLSEDSAKLAWADTAIVQYNNTISEYMDKFRKHADLTSEEKEWLASWDAAWSAYKAERDSVLRLSREGRKIEAIGQAMSTAATKFGAARDSLEGLVRAEKRLASDAQRQAIAIYEMARLLIVIGSAAAALLAIAISLFVSRAITLSVRAMAVAADRLANIELPGLVKVFEAVAKGDLTQTPQVNFQRVEVKSSDETGDLAMAFNRMVDQLGVAGEAVSQMVLNLRSLLGELNRNALGLASASEQLSQAAQQAGAATQQIASSIQQVARGAQEQSASVQQTSASMQQLSSAIEQIAKGAQEQARRVEEATGRVRRIAEAIGQVAMATQELERAAGEMTVTAGQGSEVVGKAVGSLVLIKDRVGETARRIRELGKHSEEIGQIVEVIDDIAEQTNLLALNAAIEAARAGEHGRGFAVVADEVRKLAERSSRATKEIGQLIRAVQRGTEEAVQAMELGVKEVEEGSGLASEAGEALRRIRESVAGAHEGVKRIAELASGIRGDAESTVSAVLEVMGIVQQSGAATEQMAASSGEVVKAVDSIASVSEESAAVAEEVSASTEEMSAQVEEMVASVEGLARMAEELRQFVGRFKLVGATT